MSSSSGGPPPRTVVRPPGSSRGGVENFQAGVPGGTAPVPGGSARVTSRGVPREVSNTSSAPREVPDTSLMARRVEIRRSQRNDRAFGGVKYLVESGGAPNVSNTSDASRGRSRGARHLVRTPRQA